MVVSESKANVYWLGELGNYIDKTISKWEKFIKAQIPGAEISNSEFHCTMVYDPKHDPEIEKRWLSSNRGQKVPLVLQYIVIGKHRATMQIDDD